MYMIAGWEKGGKVRQKVQWGACAVWWHLAAKDVELSNEAGALRSTSGGPPRRG